MSKTPGTVSKILWHFTGGGTQIGDDPNRRTRPKSVKKSVSILSSIVRSQLLRTSSGPENVQVSVPEIRVENVNGGTELVHGYNHWKRSTVSVVCLADIPIQHLSYHSQRYGKVAIGFHRNQIQYAKFNPVFYVNKYSHIARSLASLCQLLEDGANPELFNSIAEFIDLPDEQRDKCLEVLTRYLKFPMQELQKILSNLKTFNNQQYSDIYCEREWRSEQEYEFQMSDVAMIVMPKSNGVLQRFIDEHPDIPRIIPIVSWEDLIEH